MELRRLPKPAGAPSTPHFADGDMTKNGAAKVALSRSNESSVGCPNDACDQRGTSC